MLQFSEGSGIDIGQQISESIDGYHDAFDCPFGRETTPRDNAGYQALSVDRRSKRLQWHASGHMGSDRCKYISTMEGLTHGRQKIAPVFDGNDACFGLIGQHPLEQAVVRGEKAVAGRFHCQNATLASDTRIHDRHMDAARWKVGKGRGENKGAMDDILGIDLMGDIHRLGLIMNTGDDPLHHTDIFVLKSKIGQKSDQRHPDHALKKLFLNRNTQVTIGQIRDPASRGGTNHHADFQKVRLDDIHQRITLLL